MASDAAGFLAEATRRVEEHLQRVLPAAETEPKTLHAAMRHSLFAGGKRLRPALTLASAQAAGLADLARALPAAAALEMIHTYSLIHDDLPCMDNDALRRGRPTCHIVYGEAIAILAGDALLTLAFTHLAEEAARGTLPLPTFPRLVAHLGAAAGVPAGMVAGQVADIEAEHRAVTADELAWIHRRKTGAIIEAACVCGGLVAEAPKAVIQALSRHGQALGLCFQIVDDILDATQTSETLGKTAGKDVTQGKATFVALHGLDAARAEAQRQAALAREAAAPLGGRAAALLGLLDAVTSRTS